QSDRDFTLRLEDYPMVDARLDTSDTTLGARVLVPGYLARDKSFVEAALVNPKQPLVAWSKWTRDPEAGESAEWISPSGKTFQGKLLPGPEYHVMLAGYPGPL